MRQGFLGIHYQTWLKIIFKKKKKKKGKNIRNIRDVFSERARQQRPLNVGLHASQHAEQPNPESESGLKGEGGTDCTRGKDSY